MPSYVSFRSFALIATGVAVIAYVAVTAVVGFGDVVAAAERVGIGGLAIALSLSLVNYGLRFARWEAYLKALGHSLPRLASLRIYIAGFAWTVTPAKAGEALRGLLLERWGVPLRASVAAFLSERLSDLGAIVLLSMTGLAMYPESQLLVLAGLGGSVLGWLLLSRPAAAGLARRVATSLGGSLRTFAGHVTQTLEASRLCHRSGLAVSALALSVAAWAAEAVALYLMLGWMGAEVPLAVAVFAYALAVLAGALSFIPGGLGGTEAVMIAVLLWQRVPADIAVASTLLIRLTTLWFAVVLGMASLASLVARRTG